jgi:hypothetical protein
MAHCLLNKIKTFVEDFLEQGKCVGREGEGRGHLKNIK